MRRPATYPLILLVAAGFCPCAAAQDTSEADAPAQTPREVTLGQPAPSDPLSPEAQDRDTIDSSQGSDARDGRSDIPTSRIEVDPRVLGVAPGEPLPTLRREGEFIRNRTGHLLPAGERGYAVFILDPDEEAGDDRPIAMVVAPNRALESLEDLVEERGEKVGFTVTGQVHTYRGVNYLLITAPPKPWLEAPNETAGEAQPAESQEPAEASEAVEVQQEEPPQDESAADDPDTPLSPEQELEELLRQRGTPGAPDSANRPNTGSPANTPGSSPQPMRMPDIPRGGNADNPAVLGIAPEQQQAELVGEGTIMVRRTGRLVRSGDGSHAIFIFDSDGSENPEPPMILQACKLLEEMEAILYNQGGYIPFVITGQVQSYRGANYLLPTIMRQEFDRGNLE